MLNSLLEGSPFAKRKTLAPLWGVASFEDATTHERVLDFVKQIVDWLQAKKGAPLSYTTL